jgi:hypothetical protein
MITMIMTTATTLTVAIMKGVQSLRCGVGTQHGDVAGRPSDMAKLILVVVKDVDGRNNFHPHAVRERDIRGSDDVAVVKQEVPRPKLSQLLLFGLYL